jgi:hypothetical protein
MSVLVLGVASLEFNSDQPMITTPRREIFEKVVVEMSRLVDEMIQLVEESAGAIRADLKQKPAVAPPPSN